ncbi:MAG: hypothetical protein ACRENS_13840 [Candidatus Eiseniibacteriota bacterium]
MKRPLGTSLFALAALAMAVSAAGAGIRPYVRVGAGGSQLVMSDVNTQISALQASFQSVNIPADLHSVGAGFGPFGSAGLWLFPDLRVGATVSYLRSTLHNRVHTPGVVFYDDQADFRMTEFGGEAALRIVSLGGLMIGGQVGQGRGELIEGYSWEDAGGQTYIDDTANRTQTTYGAFLGFDQTNERGLAGFVRAGYVWRKIGSMPSSGILSDGVTSVPITGQSVKMDFSGF